jgi:DNA-binding response OmpR family regulator
LSAAGRPLVLLVEDSEPVRAAFTILLEESGYDVAVAGTGEDAVHLALARPPDLVLLDLGLPDCDGRSVAVELKSTPSTADVPIVALTGRDEDSERAALLAAGCAAYLVKPVDTRALIRALPGYIATRPIS